MTNEDPQPVQISALPYRPIDGDPVAPSDNLGPAWIQLHGAGSYTINSPDGILASPVTRFVATALNHAGALDSDEYAYGTVYAVRNPIGCTAGDLHFDGGRYDPDRRVTRVVTAWSSDGTPVMNAFTRHVHPVFDARIAGLATTDLPPGILVQPDNGHLVAFDEGIHLHGRVAAKPNPHAYGVFLSLSLYRLGQPPDLHCPRLAALRGWGPAADLADGYRSFRTRY